MSDEVDRIAQIKDPYRQLREATAKLADAQYEVTELGRRRRRVIQDLHDQGQSYAQIADAAGLSRGRIHQIRHQGPAPEGAFLATGLVRILTPLKRDEIKGRPVIAVEDVAASKQLEDLARSFGLDVEQGHVPLGGNLDLNQSGLVVICGPRLSDVMGQLYEHDPVLEWEKTPKGVWALRDTITDRLYVSGSDKEPSDSSDVAYLGRLPRPDGNGRLIAFTGIHPQGTLGAVQFITTEIAALWAQVKDSEFSVVLDVRYNPDTYEPEQVKRLTPLYMHDAVRS
jgi:hypothetical protein